VRRIIAILALSLSAIADARSADLRRFVAGDQTELFVGWEAPGDGTGEPHLELYRRRPDGRFVRPPGLTDLRGRLRHAAVSGAALWLLFADGAMVRIDTDGHVAQQRQLPEGADCVLLAGGTDQPYLWALARGARVAGTQPAVTTTRTTSPATGTAPARRLALYRLQFNEWVPDELPADVPSAGDYWLTAWGQSSWLLWRSRRSPNGLWIARRRGLGAWGPPRAIDDVPAARIVDAFAVDDKRVVLLAGESDGPEERFLRPYRYDDVQEPGGTWLPGRRLREGPTPLAPAPGSWAAGRCGDRLYVLWAADGTIRIGAWEADGQPAGEVVSIDPQQRRGDWPVWRPYTMTVAAVMLLLFVVLLWRRRSAFTQPMPLPEGVMLAGLARRLAAALIDLAPAMVLAGLLLRTELAEVVTAYRQDLPLTTQQLINLWIWWLSTRMVWGVYGIVTETLIGASAGKMVMGLRVVGESGRPARAWQVAVRNLVRIFEVEKDLLPLLIVPLLSRNRQRLGDLLARTLVIQRAEGAAEDSSDAATRP